MLDSWRSLQGYERSLWTFGGSHHQNQLRPLRHLFGPLVAPFRPYRGRLRPQRSNMESSGGDMRPLGSHIGSQCYCMGLLEVTWSRRKVTWGMQRWHGVSKRPPEAHGRSFWAQGKSFQASKATNICSQENNLVLWRLWGKSESQSMKKLILFFRLFTFTFFAVSQLLVSLI